jgi:DNA-binding MarR family transcriptional regulator
MPAATAPAARELRSDAGLASSLRISVMRLARRLRLERGRDDLTLNQLGVLGTLDRCGPRSAGELAAIERVKPPSMTRTVASLEEAGLVTRRPHDTDGRQVVIELTQTAREVIQADRRRREAWLAQRLAELDPAKRDLLRQVAPLLEELAGS